uniref:Lytic transglycosylase catalytic n=1 Tax=Caulobacter sp. (strain K31) TaxID=366602 RepID=B0SV59_CAUSK
MRDPSTFARVTACAKFIPLFAGKPSHPSVPLDDQSAIARSEGQGRPSAGARALPLTEASTVASCRRRGGGTPVHIAILLLVGISFTAIEPAAALAQNRSIERPSSPDPYADFIAEASQRFGIPTAWIRAIMRVESANDVRAISPKGAMGLMQIMPATWADLRARHRLGDNPYDPRDNILAGAAYLRELHDRYGSPGFLAAYNAGPGRYEEYVATGRALPAETRAYVAVLTPLVGDGATTGPITVATVDPLAWVRAPLFIGRNERIAAADPVQPDRSSIDAPTAIPVRDPAAIAPQSDGLFVARSERRGPQ